MGPWSRLGRVGEGETSVVDDPIIPHQGDRDLGRLANPLPTTSELRYIRHHAKHTLLELNKLNIFSEQIFISTYFPANHVCNLGFKTK